MFIKYGCQRIVNTYNILNIDKESMENKYFIMFEKGKDDRTCWIFHDVKERDSVYSTLIKMLKVREINVNSKQQERGSKNSG
jgi:hypothetical protein